MSVLDKFLRIGQGEPTEVKPQTSVGNPVPPFNPPTDPSKVYLKEVPHGEKPTIYGYPDPQQLENVNVQLANKARKLRDLAGKLRKYKDEDLKKLYVEYQDAVKAFKNSVKYDKSLVELENLIKEVGNNLLQLMVESGDTSYGLFKVENSFIVIQREISESPGSITDADKLKAIEEILKRDYGDQTTEEIFQRASQVAQQASSAIIHIKDRFATSPVPEDYLKHEGQIQYDTKYMLTKLNDSIISLLIMFHNMDSEINDSLNDLQHFGLVYNENNVIQMPQFQPLERAASHETVSETLPKHLASEQAN